MGKCKHFYINSIADSDLPARMIISSDKTVIVVIESKKKAYVYDGTKDWFIEETMVDMRFQSQLTFDLVKSLFMTGICELPSYDEAMKTHMVFIGALIDRLKTITGEDMKECPIM